MLHLANQLADLKQNWIGMRHNVSVKPTVTTCLQHNHSVDYTCVIHAYLNDRAYLGSSYGSMHHGL